MNYIKKSKLIFAILLIVPIIILIFILSIEKKFYLNIDDTFLELLPEDYQYIYSKRNIARNDDTLETLENIKVYENAFYYLKEQGIKLDLSLYDSKTKYDYFMLAIHYRNELFEKQRLSFDTIFRIWIILLVVELVSFISISIIKRREKRKK